MSEEQKEKVRALFEQAARLVDRHERTQRRKDAQDAWRLQRAGETLIRRSIARGSTA